LESNKTRTEKLRINQSMLRQSSYSAQKIEQVTQKMRLVGDQATKSRDTTDKNSLKSDGWGR